MPFGTAPAPTQRRAAPAPIKKGDSGPNNRRAAPAPTKKGRLWLRKTISTSFSIISVSLSGVLTGDNRGRPGRPFPRAGGQRGGRVQYRGAPVAGQGGGTRRIQPHTQGNRQWRTAQVRRNFFCPGTVTLLSGLFEMRCTGTFTRPEFRMRITVPNSGLAPRLFFSPKTSVSDPYSSNPDPDPAKNLNPDPGRP